MAQNELSKYRVVVIGGSAGSLEVILQIVTALPTHTRASVILVTHRKYDPDSVLLSLLRSRTKLAVKEAEDKDSIQPATIYTAPPDYHLLVENKNTFSLDASEKVHFSRPSIDVTFESVADIFGPSAIGVLLSGANADGAAGLQAIKQAGGFTVAQNPETAEVNFMPQQAINAGAIDAIIDGNEIGNYIRQILDKSIA
jgi:two-component system, chemotaxis family, protein-glutamate methylesterase/glutaminase